MCLRIETTALVIMVLLFAKDFVGDVIFQIQERSFVDLRARKAHVSPRGELAMLKKLVT
jgi:hypothetical protein